MIKVWKNTSTLNGYDQGLFFTNDKSQADIILSGSKKVELDGFTKLKAIFRAGVGKDNLPIEQAKRKNILIRFPKEQTINIIFEETSNFACNLIFRIYLGNLLK